MRSIMIDGHRITQDGDAWVVAEIGHNHGGKLDTAIEMCRVAKECGCDAVKLQKRTLSRCYTKTFLSTPYNSEHAFGRTYGEHREALEFGTVEYMELMAYCKEIGITLFATAFDEEAVDFLDDLDVPCYKIASGDLTNIPLLIHICKKGKPIIISTGGAYMDQIVDADTIALLHEAQVAFLHCVASYPTRADIANISAIKTMMDRLHTCIIGYSCHYNGILLAEMAYMYGARIIEKHFTLDHTAKGSDHALSLQPQGMKNLVRNLRRMKPAYGHGEKLRIHEEEKPLEKMEKVGYPNKMLKEGAVIELSDIVLKSPATRAGIRGNRLYELAGKILKSDCSTAVPLTKDLLEDE